MCSFDLGQLSHSARDDICVHPSRVRSYAQQRRARTARLVQPERPLNALVCTKARRSRISVQPKGGGAAHRASERARERRRLAGWRTTTQWLQQLRRRGGIRRRPPLPHNTSSGGGGQHTQREGAAAAAHKGGVRRRLCSPQRSCLAANLRLCCSFFRSGQQQQ